MSGQILRPVGKLAFASALFALCAIAAPYPAFAADCLAAPNAATPANGHWYYRTDRTQQRKCWYLRTDNQNSAAVTGSVPSDKPPQSPPAAPYSLASFKEYLRQRTGATPSDQEVATLYAQFLEWNRRAKN